MKKQEQRAIVQVSGRQIPVRIVRETRGSIRAAIGKREVILRLPHGPFYRVDEKREMDRLRLWLEQIDARRDGALDRLAIRQYEHGQIIQVGGRRYRLDIGVEDRRTHSARLREGVIELRLAQKDKGQSLQQNIRTLLSRVIAQDFLPGIERRVDDLNDRHFQQDIRSVRLKYTHSRWGSCSQTGNINLSTRLLFAPDEVIDYVIIHELAHLIELNHSDRFWQIVERIMPDYRQHERWLQENSYRCDF